MNRLIRQRFLYAFLALAIVAVGSDARAATSAGCTAVAAGTGAAPPLFSDILTCVMDSIGVYGLIAGLLTVLVPLVVIVWGMRSGFRLIGSLFKKGAQSIARA